MGRNWFLGAADQVSAATRGGGGLRGDGEARCMGTLRVEYMRCGLGYGLICFV